MPGHSYLSLLVKEHDLVPAAREALRRVGPQQVLHLASPRPEAGRRDEVQDLDDLAAGILVDVDHVQQGARPLPADPQQGPENVAHEIELAAAALLGAVGDAVQQLEQLHPLGGGGQLLDAALEAVGEQQLRQENVQSSSGNNQALGSDDKNWQLQRWRRWTDKKGPECMTNCSQLREAGHGQAAAASGSSQVTSRGRN
jgi:hypothetical protein